MYICEKCGRETAEKFGSGRFCSRQCSNSRTFSSDAKEKKREAVKGTIAYSNGLEVRYFKPSDAIPEGFVKGNFSKAKNFATLEEFAKREQFSLSKKSKSAPRDKSIRYYRNLCKQQIDDHNRLILAKYEKLLANKALDKEFKPSGAFMFANYLSITAPDHPRQHEGHVFVHILLAEKLLDRQLLKHEIVHHKDSDKLHNTFDNIYIFNDKASHARFHYGKYYWLSINTDVLICDAISKDQLKDIYNNSVLNS